MIFNMTLPCFSYMIIKRHVDGGICCLLRAQPLYKMNSSGVILSLCSDEPLDFQNIRNL